MSEESIRICPFEFISVFRWLNTKDVCASDWKTPYPFVNNNRVSKEAVSSINYNTCAWFNPRKRQTSIAPTEVSIDFSSCPFDFKYKL